MSEGVLNIDTQAFPKPKPRILNPYALNPNEHTQIKIQNLSGLRV